MAATGPNGGGAAGLSAPGDGAQAGVISVDNLAGRGVGDDHD